MRSFEKEKTQYGEDYSRQDDPWKLWECQHPDFADYRALTTDPKWNPACKYRRKLKKVTINGVELVAPETEAPSVGTTYWVVCLTVIKWAKPMKWLGDESDMMWLERELVFLEKDHAVAYAKAKWTAKAVSTDKLIIPKQYQASSLFGTPWKEVVIFYENGPALAVPRSQCEEG